MDRATSNASIRGVPVHNTTCGFVVIAKGAEIAELNSNNVLCRSPGKYNYVRAKQFSLHMFIIKLACIYAICIP